MTELAIRRAEPRDLDPLARLYDYYVVQTPITFDLEPFGTEGRRSWLEGFGETGRHQLFVAEGPTGVLGYAASQTFRPKAAYQSSVETSIYIEPASHRQGFGSHLYQALFAALADEDVHRAYAAITLPNEASIALHERFGFRSVGTLHEVGHKQGRYWDVEWYEKTMDAAPGG